jgi:hypothetical protein
MKCVNVVLTIALLSALPVYLFASYPSIGHQDSSASEEIQIAQTSTVDEGGAPYSAAPHHRSRYRRHHRLRQSPSRNHPDSARYGDSSAANIDENTHQNEEGTGKQAPNEGVNPDEEGGVQFHSNE